MKRSIERIFAFLFIVLAMTVFMCACADTSGDDDDDTVADPPRYRAVGYLPDWSYNSFDVKDFDKLTHLNISFCNPKGDGFGCGIPDGDFKRIVTAAHGVKTKVLAALGGGGYGDPYRNLIATNESRTALNDKIEKFCLDHDLDGIDLDIELDSSDVIWMNYGAWVSELRTICDEHGWLLSTATAQWVAHGVSKETFAMFDYLNVMAYDDDSRPSSHSSYECATDMLDYFEKTKGVSKEKLVLGVPFYGRGYSGGRLDWSSYMSFKDIVNSDKSLYEADYTASGIAYNGAATMKKKCALAKNYGGIMIWEITLDAGGDYSLLKLIDGGLRGAV